VSWKDEKMAWLAPIFGALLFILLISLFEIKIKLTIVLFSVTVGIGSIIGVITTIKCWKNKTDSRGVSIHCGVGLLIILLAIFFVIYAVFQILSLGSIG
jgi:hypothetical protein